jgi:hypothetical protein
MIKPAVVYHAVQTVKCASLPTPVGHAKMDFIKRGLGASRAAQKDNTWVVKGRIITNAFNAQRIVSVAEPKVLAMNVPLASIRSLDRNRAVK